MGVIKRQGLKSTFVTYFFMAFGIVSNLLIYTKMLEVQELGTIAFVLTTGITFAPFVLLGFHVMYLKYFARFEKEPTDLSRLYSLTLYGPIVLSIILCTSYLIFRESIVSYYTVNRDVPEIAIDLAILLSTIIPFISALTYVCSTLQRTAIPALLNNSIKVFQPTLVILYFYELLSFNLVLILVSGFYILLLLVFFFYQQKQRRIKFIVNPKEILALPETNKMVQFAIYGFAIGAGGMLITNIDGFMVASLLGMKDMGLYNWGLTIINAIIIPFGMLSNISSPFISSYWESGNMKELNKLYKQSANVLLLLCTGLYFAVWLGIDDLFLIIPKGNQYMLAKYAILLIGGAKVLDAATGFNNTIIALSPSHKSFLGIIGFSAILNIILNFYFIPIYGINGAAFATLISFILFNLIKYFYIKINFKLSPFNLNYLYIFVVSSSLFGLFYILPRTNYASVNILIRSVGFLLFYFPSLYFLKFSKEYNDLIDGALQKLKFKKS